MKAGTTILIVGFALAVSYGMANRYEMSGAVLLDQFTGQVVMCDPARFDPPCRILREGGWLW